MSKKLEGRVAVVTGGSAGIGLGAAKRFAEEGARVFITGRDKAKLDEALAVIGHGASRGAGSSISRAATSASTC